MYTYDGSYFGANGVAFHSNRPISFETFILNSLVAAPVAGGAVTVPGGTQGSAISVVDNAALFGIGSDFPGDAASFQSRVSGPRFNGIPGEYGGWNLLFSSSPLSTFSGTANTYGVLWSLDGWRGPGCLPSSRAPELGSSSMTRPRASPPLIAGTTPRTRACAETDRHRDHLA